MTSVRTRLQQLRPVWGKCETKRWLVSHDPPPLLSFEILELISKFVSMYCNFFYITFFRPYAMRVDVWWLSYAASAPSYYVFSAIVVCCTFVCRHRHPFHHSLSLPLFVAAGQSGQLITIYYSIFVHCVNLFQYFVLT